MEPDRLARARGLEAVVRLPGWSYEPARYIAGTSVHVVPSREESWSQSAVLALGPGVPVVGTAVDGLTRTLGQGRGVLVPPEAPHALAAALSRVLAGERPDPVPGRAYARQFTPRGSSWPLRQRLPPAARQVRRANRATAVKPAPSGGCPCRVARSLAEMAAHGDRQDTSLQHVFKQSGSPGEAPVLVHVLCWKRWREPRRCSGVARASRKGSRKAEYQLVPSVGTGRLGACSARWAPARFQSNGCSTTSRSGAARQVPPEGGAADHQGRRRGGFLRPGALHPALQAHRGPDPWTLRQGRGRPWPSTPAATSLIRATSGSPLPR
jgi:hypothetical protein